MRTDLSCLPLGGLEPLRGDLEEGMRRAFYPNGQKFWGWTKYRQSTSGTPSGSLLVVHPEFYPEF
jgi:hypothetical protein